MVQYDLSRAEVLACLAYYFDHETEFQRVMEAEDERLAEAAEPSSEWEERMYRRLIAMGLTLRDDTPG